MKKAIGSLLIAAGVMSAHAVQAEEGFSKAVDYRNSVMTVLKWNMSKMGAVLKGKADYDPAGFSRLAADLSAAAHLDVGSGFPEGSDEAEGSSARMDIWMQWEDFDAKLNDLRQAAQMLEITAKSGQLKEIVPKFSAVGKACKACHDAYKD